MKVITEQNGGHDYYTNEEGIDYLEKRRSYILAEISPNLYDIFNKNKRSLEHGIKDVNRSGGILLKVFKPGEKLEFDHELLTMEDHEFTSQIICYSTFFTSDIIETHQNVNEFRVLAIDMIWCRENVLFDRLNQLTNSGYIYS